MYIATLPCEISVFKNCHARGVHEANCQVKLSSSNSKLSKNILFCDTSIIQFTDNKMLTAAVLKILRPTVQNCCNREKDAEMSHMINSQSDTDCFSLSVTESKIRYSRLIFHDNEVKLA